MKNYQVGYRLSDGKVRYAHLTHDEGITYNHLQTDDARKEFLQNVIAREKIRDAINTW